MGWSVCIAILGAYKADFTRLAQANERRNAERRKAELDRNAKRREAELDRRVGAVFAAVGGQKMRPADGSAAIRKLSGLYASRRYRGALLRPSTLLRGD